MNEKAVAQPKKKIPPTLTKKAKAKAFKKTKNRANI